MRFTKPGKILFRNLIIRFNSGYNIIESSLFNFRKFLFIHKITKVWYNLTVVANYY